MAEIRREGRSTEQSASEQRKTRQPEAKNDIERQPATHHEVQPSLGRGTQRTDLARRGGLDVARDPFALMNSFRREMDRLFDDFGFGGLFRMPRLLGDLDRPLGDLGGSLWSPQVEVFEKEGKLHVSADLPGLNKEDVKIELLDNNLTIEGERQSEQRDEHGHWSERSYGHFLRTIPLPEGVNPDTAKASFENGVLDIAFDAPQLEQRRGRRIEIGQGSSATKKI